MKQSVITFMMLFLLLSNSNTKAQTNSNAFTWRNNIAYNNYLMEVVHQQYADRSKEISEAFTSEEAMLKYRDNCIQRYKKIIGDFPEKNNLNAKIVGTSQQEGFRVERIIFESVPQRYVTANLYIPDGEGPFPVALELCGHSLNGKTSLASAPQFALNGIAVLVADPIGQGERIQLHDDNNQPLTRGVTTEHTLLNAGANLLGSSVAAYEYWDNHRAIDYLETRKDIDKSRIGVYGFSGGGTQSVYMLGLDERIKVASTGIYFTQRERMLELYGPADGCQHIPYEGREQLELADFTLMIAPKPVLIIAGRYDNNADYWGVTQAFDELKRTYSTLGNPEKVSLFTFEGGHEVPVDASNSLISWFKKWMNLDDLTVVGSNNIKVPLNAMLCTSTGQVNTSISGSQTIPEYHIALSKEYTQQRTDFVKQGKDDVTQKVMELLGISIPSEKIEPKETGTTKMRNYDLKKFQIARKGQMPVPCIVLIPENVQPDSPVNLYLNEGGKDHIFSDETTVGSYINQNNILVLADLRGFGETEDPLSLNDTKCWNREYRNAMISMHVGMPVMGQRVIDIFSLLDFFDSNPTLKGRKVNMLANGAYGPAAVHAAFLDQRIDKAEVFRSIKTFNDLIKDPMQRDAFSNVLYGVLQYYDLQDLVQLSENRVRFID